MRVRAHEVTVDPFEDDGGRNRGPSQTELMAGLLGPCIAMMVQGYRVRNMTLPEICELLVENVRSTGVGPVQFDPQRYFG